MRIGSLFSGIGGLELGLEWAGVGHTVWQVESDPFCRRVLEQHWPEAQRFDDVRDVGSNNLAPVDLICGGFPCQDISSAGKGAGLAGKRSGLWGEYARILGELRPEWAVVENVASGAIRWVDDVARQLGWLGYETLPVPVSAADVGAPYPRKRVFVIARADGEHVREQPRGVVRQGREDQAEPIRTPWWATPPEVDAVVSGFPGRVDHQRALGNAVVPQCAEVIGWVIRELAA